MATINDLISQIENVELRERIQKEVDALSRQKKFGLVFEDHIPECTLLYDVPVQRGRMVAIKGQDANIQYFVYAVADGIAHCINKSRNESVEIPVEKLVCVAQFGDPIYPYLKPIDAVCNAPDSDLWHTLIEADNYHALQLLEYLYAGKVDCIYIDPPYNTGAKDWKYNNDYVDGNDTYRHSKWLSMMEKRLKLAKKLLNPQDSVLIVTIDEKEYLHLGCLLEEIFQDARIQMVSSVINPAIVSRAGEFGRSGEYLYFVMLGASSPLRVRLPREWVSSKGRTHTGNVRWDLLQRSGTNARRVDRPNLFYPIYINPEDQRIISVGDPISIDSDRSEITPIEGTYAIWPIRANGDEGNWQWGKDSFVSRLRQGRVRIGGNPERGFTVYILKDGEYSKILNGEFNIIGRGVNNEIIVEDNDTDYVMATPGDIWKISSHDATQYGSRLLGNIFADRRFTFPKSLYAVKDSVRFFTENKPNALVIDFFAGSGTTLHAVNLLNAEDGGNRRCILVTNNEVSADEAKNLTTQGHQPGDPEWERLGIAHYVTWPRTVCSIEGHDVNGAPLKGNYLGSDRPMSEGFKANAAFFKLGFLDKHSVAMGRQFREMLPTLWMKAGCHGPCPRLEGENIPDMLVLPENRFAVLNREDSFDVFAEQVNALPEIETVYLVTDSGTTYRFMSEGLKAERKYQLYRDYLDNFRINTRR